jgi:hypothetical protein
LPLPSPSLPLDQTVQDLRTAAQIVAHHGYSRGEYVNHAGQVCAAGAVGIATGYMVRYYDEPTGSWDFRNIAAHGPEITSEAESKARYLQAMQALAPILPIDTCGGGCQSLGPDGPTLTSYHEHLRTAHPNDVVFHYNDFICEGGDELISALTEAAEKLEADLP